MRILIADDETVSREKLRLIMTHFGEVEAFESGAEAFTAYEAAHEAKRFAREDPTVRTVDVLQFCS